MGCYEELKQWTEERLKENEKLFNNNYNIEKEVLKEHFGEVLNDDNSKDSR